MQAKRVDLSIGLPPTRPMQIATGRPITGLACLKVLQALEGRPLGLKTTDLIRFCDGLAINRALKLLNGQKLVKSIPVPTKKESAKRPSAYTHVLTKKGRQFSKELQHA